jgi:hypothetical protein
MTELIPGTSWPKAGRETGAGYIISRVGVARPSQSLPVTGPSSGGNDRKIAGARAYGAMLY